ncbi:MAG: redoxin domain-containing protein [Sphingobacteriaceae bacterium]|nr:redoxin domain-containing protein [Sphingobacteriaceae bacterium]
MIQKSKRFISTNTLRAILFTATLYTQQVILAQEVKQVFKIDELVAYIQKNEKPTVINFWATWCKPCVQELPSFDSLNASNKDVKVILVSLDFREDLEKKVNPFLKKKALQSECVLLDEVNGNDFINKIAPEWTGAIPGTLFMHGNKKIFVEKKMHLKELNEHLEELKSK